MSQNPTKEPTQSPIETVKSPESPSDIYKDIFDEISTHALIDQIPKDEQAEALRDTFELYVAAKEIVAPVITGFADSLLSHADGRQIIFAGRDGIGPFIAASLLKEKFHYPQTDNNQLIYAYLTRRVVQNSSPDILLHYLSQQGLEDPSKSVVLADIGMYGSIVGDIQRVLPKLDTQYLISKNRSIPGYADNDTSPMSSLTSVVGNPAVHFLEDTFSGDIPSPTQLIDVDGTLMPNTEHGQYPPEELLKRTYALRAIEDYTKSISEKPSGDRMAIAMLDTFLGDPSHFRHMMVPHARSY